LRAYADVVTPGSYLVVEDTNLNGHPVESGFGPGPMEAVHAFLAERQDFAVDIDQEKFFLTFNPSGYLRRASGQ
jgi:cephalosporin hydroxylase